MSRPSEIEFPPIDSADEDGLLMIGGRLSAPWLLAAYRRGIFPWPFDEAPLAPVAWWCPDPRAVIEWENFHVSRRLRTTINSNAFEVTMNRDFAGVLNGCAQPRGDGAGTWLTEPLQRAFADLHRLGHAHSVEAWREGRLVGGAFGLAIGGYFSAESMFFRRRDASKVALSHLVNHLRERGFTLLDIQVLTDHTHRMGATEISRNEFLRRLEQAVALTVAFDGTIC